MIKPFASIGVVPILTSHRMTKRKNIIQMANLTQSIKLEKLLFYGQILNVTNEVRQDYQDPLKTKFSFKFIVNDDKIDDCGFIELSQDCNTIKDFINNLFIFLHPIK